MINLEIMSPKRSDFVLATHIPDCKTDILVLHCLDIEPNGGNGGHNLTQLQFVQNCSLTSCIQT